jgi:hypothetical protein
VTGFGAPITPGYQNAGTSATGTLPAGVSAGDLVFAFTTLSDVSIGDPSVSGGAGGGTWNVVGPGAVDDGLCRTKLWWRTVVPGDASATITTSWTSSGKGGLVLAHYTAPHPTTPIDGTPPSPATESGTDTTHDAPGVTPTMAGCWVVDFVGQRSAACTTITAPAGRTERVEQLGAGAGTVCQIVADSDGPVAAGVATGATTYTFSASTANAVGWSVAIRPADASTGPPRLIVARAAVHRAASW